MAANTRPRREAPEPHVPKPERLPPFVLTIEEARDPKYIQFDFDYTTEYAQDVDQELRLRYQRNVLIKSQLLEGKSVVYRSSGNSLWPRVQSGQKCTFIPVRAAGQKLQQLGVYLHVGDIVFCEVQPRDRFFAHEIKEIETIKWVTYYSIGNARGHINGWCEAKHIYGKLVGVED